MFREILPIPANTPAYRHLRQNKARKPALLCDGRYIAIAAMWLACGRSQDDRRPRDDGSKARRMTMSHLGIYASTALACASLIFASGMGPAASATEVCSQHYKICNWSCDQPVDAVDNVPVCKSRCDLRLIACDRQPINASAQGERYSPQSLPAKGNGGPIADGGDKR
jgi:hypothetical protein